MPALRKTKDPQAVLNRAAEDVAEWLHHCYQLTDSEEPGTGNIPSWQDLEEKRRARYLRVARKILTTPLDAWLTERNRDPSTAERIVL